MSNFWTTPGRIDKFEYIRVSWSDFIELHRLDGVTSCSIDESLFTSLKSSGKLGYKMDNAEQFNIKDDLIRVYSISSVGGQTKRVCHGTFFATGSSVKQTGKIGEGSLDLYSTLKVLQDEQTTQTLTVPEGTNIVDFANQLIKDRHLKTVVTGSDSVAKNDITYEFGTSYLKVVNELMAYIGYRAVYPSAYGDICLSPRVELSSLQPTACMSDTDIHASITESNFDSDFDASSVPNVVVVKSESQDGKAYRAVAVNDDKNNAWSTVNRKKIITRCETVQDINSQRQADDKAKELLHNSMMQIETISIKHFYLPFAITDAVDFDFSRSQKVAKYSATKRTIEMKPGIPCTTSMRRFVDLLGATS